MNDNFVLMTVRRANVKASASFIASRGVYVSLNGPS